MNEIDLDTLSGSALLDVKQAAAALSVAPATLENWRWAGRGPAFVRIGLRRVRYRVADLRAWLAARTVTPS
jgi:predicted DNA-binding transcriptional regulator AlpA